MGLLGAVQQLEANKIRNDTHENFTKLTQYLQLSNANKAEQLAKRSDH